MCATSEMPQATKRPAASVAPATCPQASGASVPHTWLTLTPTFSNTSPRISRDSPPPFKRWPSGFVQLRAAKRLAGSNASKAAQQRACRSRKYAVAVPANSSALLMYEVHHARHGVRVGIGPDAVAEIEDVPGGIPGGGDHRGGRALQVLGRGEQRCRVEIALHRL